MGILIVFAAIAFAALAGMVMLIGLLLQAALWFVLLPFRLLGWILVAPFLLLKVILGAVFSILFVLPAVILGGLAVAFVALVATVVVPLLPLALIALVIWTLLKVGTRPAAALPPPA